MAAVGLAIIRRGNPLRIFGPLVSASYWLAMIHVLSGLLVGGAFALIWIFFFRAGIGMLEYRGVPPHLILLLVVLILLIALSELVARIERARFGLLLDRHIARPLRDIDRALPAWKRSGRFLIHPVTLKQTAYLAIRVPLSLAQSAVLIVIWTAALDLIALPAYYRILPGSWKNANGFVQYRSELLTAAVALGVLLVLLAPLAARLMVIIDAPIASFLLGPSRKAALAARIGELERSRAGVVDAAQNERLRLERDLHDGAQQRLVALAMDLGRAKAKFDDDPAGARAIVEEAHAQAKEALAELRNLVRGVHPPVLTDRGLDAALSGLAVICPVPVRVEVDLPCRPPAQVEAIAYFVVAEALTNVAKHAHASQAQVLVDRPGKLLRLTVRDDGIGGADPAGPGLAGLAGRVAGVDGRLLVVSPAGGPTSIEVQLPCE